MKTAITILILTLWAFAGHTKSNLSVLKANSKIIDVNEDGLLRKSYWGWLPSKK